VSITDELLVNNARYTKTFNGPLPLPPAKHVTDNQFKKSIQDDTGIKPAWSAEAFPDLDEDVRQSIARIKASPFVPNKKSIRGFVFDVATGKLHEVQDHHRVAVVKTSFLDRLVRRLGA
jgi:hypothetical protein